jgi:hypothetical protein
VTQEQKIIRAKLGLLELAKQLGNVSQACKMMGYSRDSFYRGSPFRNQRKNEGPELDCRVSNSQQMRTSSKPVVRLSELSCLDSASGSRHLCVPQQ